MFTHLVERSTYELHVDGSVDTGAGISAAHLI